MNFRNLKRLEKTAKDISILYIEKDEELHKKMEKFLNKLFDRYYLAYDGLSGYETFKKQKPDIVITSLDTPLKNGIELIADLQDIQEDVKIIVLNMKNKDTDLLESIDLGISDIIFKPLDFDKLTIALIKTIEEFDQSVFKEALKKIKNIKNKNSDITLINTYKGILIENKVTITDMENDEITISANKASIKALKRQKYAILKDKKEDRYFKLFLLNYNLKKGTITCVKPKTVQTLPLEFISKGLGVDKSFRVVLRYKSESFDLKCFYASKSSVTLFSNIDLGLKVSDQVELTLGFDVKSNGILNKIQFGKVFTKGEISGISPYKSGKLIEFQIKVNKPDQRMYFKYLDDIEAALYNELFV
ncbi:MAG: response regulator [Campylobacterota bacterium]|nr:response regulator [Campylobacterota bacterium]